MIDYKEYFIKRMINIANKYNYNQVNEKGKKCDINDKMFKLYLTNLEVIPSFSLQNSRYSKNHLFINSDEKFVEIGHKYNNHLVKFKIDDKGYIKKITLSGVESIYLYNELVGNYKGGKYKL